MLVCIMLGCLGHIKAAQPQAAAENPCDRAGVEAKWSALKSDRDRDPTETLRETDAMLECFQYLGDHCHIAEVCAMRGVSYERLGDLDSALISIHRSLKLFQPDCDSIVLMRAYVSLTNFYVGKLHDHHKVDSVCSYALSLWNPTWNETVLRNALWTNRAIAKANLGDLEGSAKGFRMVYQLARGSGDSKDADDALANLGALKSMIGELDSATYYFNIALENAKLEDRKRRMVNQYINLAWVANKRKQYKKAIPLLDSANTIARSIGDLAMQVKTESDLAENYHSLGDPTVAYEHLMAHRQLNDSLLNTEKIHAVAELEERYESEKKIRQIKELQVQKLDVELKNEKATRERNIFLFSGIGVFMIAGGLWSRLRYVRRSRAAISAEKDISEGLLHNILPEEVADELRATGHAEARLFDTATVLFTDFKGFTQLSEKLTPAELVQEIDHCFKAFDGIMEQYGVEKIKTIGDSYMAAGGLPDPTKASVADVVMAALDMRDFMEVYKKKRVTENRMFFEMRIGINTGPAIAGIVGVKKFQYDIWGDTVNSASRMESSGEVGAVNISGTTFESLKGDARFRFVSRGAIAAKGKGEMPMWFVDRA